MRKASSPPVSSISLNFLSPFIGLMPNVSISINLRTTPSTFRRDVELVHMYPFSIPLVHEHALLWQFDAALGFQFLSGGSLGLLLVAGVRGLSLWTWSFVFGLSLITHLFL